MRPGLEGGRLAPSVSRKAAASEPGDVELGERREIGDADRVALHRQALLGHRVEPGGPVEGERRRGDRRRRRANQLGRSQP